MSAVHSKTIRRRLWIVIVCLPLAALGVWLALWGAGGFLVEADALRKTDALVVLSGAPERLEQAARLYQNHMADWIILTWAGTTSPQPDAQALGLPGERILVSETRVDSTRAEAQVVRRLMESRGLKTCTVITDPYHTRRARWIFQEAFQGSGLQIRVYPVQNHWYRSTTWWQSPEGWDATLREYGKLVYFLLKSGVDDLL